MSYSLVMSGWTLSTLDDLEESTLAKKIELALMGIAGQCGCGDTAAINCTCPFLYPRRADDPDWLIRVGNEDKVVLCDAQRLYEALEALPDGAPLGSPYDAPQGSVWR